MSTYPNRNFSLCVAPEFGGLLSAAPLPLECLRPRAPTMRLRYLALLVVFVPPVAVLLILMILATIRKRNITECRNCGMRKVRPSRPRGALEHTLMHVGLIPYKCAGCFSRFY